MTDRQNCKNTEKALYKLDDEVNNLLDNIIKFIESEKEFPVDTAIVYELYATIVNACVLTEILTDF